MTSCRKRSSAARSCTAETTDGVILGPAGRSRREADPAGRAIPRSADAGRADTAAADRTASAAGWRADGECLGGAEWRRADDDEQRRGVQAGELAEHRRRHAAGERQ